jgi:hypothetical protein
MSMRMCQCMRFLTMLHYLTPTRYCESDLLG